MSFIGAVAAPVRQVLANYAKDIEYPCLIVGAGNFTVASVLRSGGYSGPIKACDVSLYSSILGAYLADHPIEVSEKKECPDHLKGLLITRSTAHLAASTALLYDLREIWQLKNPFQKRYYRLYKDNWPSLMEKTLEKLAAYKAHIGAIEYQAVCGFDFLAAHDTKHTVFAFPPTYKRGYERLEKLLRAAIEWTPPVYREMTDQTLDFYRRITPFASWYVVLEKDLPDVYAILDTPCAVLPRGRGKKTYIISKKADKKIVVKKEIRTHAVRPIWPANRFITGQETLGVATLTLAQSLRLNELFLAANIDYFSGGVGLSLGFLLDGQVIGKADFTPSAHQWNLPETGSMIYIMSDLAVASRIRRLSKLILLAILSTETRHLVETRYFERFRYTITTAFSRHPASMKYRGLFKLHTRKNKDGGYMLNYYAGFGSHTLADALNIWKRKYDRE